MPTQSKLTLNHSLGGRHASLGRGLHEWHEALSTNHPPHTTLFSVLPTCSNLHVPPQT